MKPDIAGFWVKSQTYYEEPDVKFVGDFIINVQDSFGQSSTFATDMDINNLQSNWQGSVPLMKYKQIMNPKSGKL